MRPLPRTPGATRLAYPRRGRTCHRSPAASRKAESCTSLVESPSVGHAGVSVQLRCRRRRLIPDIFGADRHRLQNFGTGNIAATQPQHEGDTMPEKEIVTIDIAAANPNLSPATTFGNLVFVAGQTGRHPTTGELGRDIREQTRNVLERIKVVMEGAGTSLDNVLTVTTHLTKREDLAAYNEEYGRYFPADKPARTTVEVMLNAPELLVEITVTACIPD